MKNIPDNTVTAPAPEKKATMSSLSKKTAFMAMLLLGLSAGEINAKDFSGDKQQSGITLKTGLDEYCYANALVHEEIFFLMNANKKEEEVKKIILSKYFKGDKDGDSKVNRMIEDVKKGISIGINDLSYHFYGCKMEEFAKDLTDR
ncbi:MAG: hypothetical protein PHS92_00570 [Candidatus Gracilibacteria bacterium]|nr:hypothetical protein [Candidatus Gracilibacteria bacterium]